MVITRIRTIGITINYEKIRVICFALLGNMIITCKYILKNWTYACVDRVYVKYDTIFLLKYTVNYKTNYHLKHNKRVSSVTNDISKFKTRSKFSSCNHLMIGFRRKNRM